MAEDKEKKKEGQEPSDEEPYPDLATALHGEFILFRNDLIDPAQNIGKGMKPKKPAEAREKDGKPGLSGK